jgi:anti-anti-sigma factor
MAMGERVNRPYSEPEGEHSRSGGLVLTVVGDVPAGRVVVAGELDMLTAPRLNALLIELLYRGYRQVSVDAAGVDFLAAAGLNVLCDATRRYRAVGGRLRVVALSPHLRRLLAVARVGGGLDLDRCGGAEAASAPAIRSSGAGPARRRSENETRPDTHCGSVWSATSRRESRLT